jgi:hypothetical protein
VTPENQPPMLQLLAPDGTYGVPKGYEAYGKIIEELDQDFLKLLYTDMARIRRFDIEATALQRQGRPLGKRVLKLALATPSVKTITSFQAIESTELL